MTTVYDARSVPNYMTGGFGWGAYVAGSLYSPYGEPLLLDVANTYATMLNFSYQQGTRRLDEACRSPTTVRVVSRRPMAARRHGGQ